MSLSSIFYFPLATGLTGSSAVLDGSSATHLPVVLLCIAVIRNLPRDSGWSTAHL